MKKQLAVLFTTFLWITTSFADVGTIGPNQALLKQEAGALIIDARSAEEYNSGHVEGAINIPHDQVEKMLSKVGDDKSKEIVVYCKSGRRAGIALSSLVKAGYKNVYNAGGYDGLAPVMKTEKAG